MLSEQEYSQYTGDFNRACAGDGAGFGAFFDKYYEPDAVFEYIPNATKNIGREVTVAFWQSVHGLMLEEIQPHCTFISSPTQLSIEAPIDFKCKQDLEWVGVKHKAGDSFRLLMAGFYDFSVGGKIQTVRVYSVFNKHYQLE